MGPASSTLPSDPAASAHPDSVPEHAPAARRNDSRVMERRLPNPREALATLPEGQDFDLEPHDTIPAPTWLDDESAPAQKAP
jgi:hypothetical protein